MGFSGGREHPPGGVSTPGHGQGEGPVGYKFPPWRGRRRQWEGPEWSGTESSRRVLPSSLTSSYKKKRMTLSQSDFLVTLYQDPELICVINDVGFHTNRGLEGITWYKDGTLLLGNQKHPSQLIRYSLSEGITGRWETETSEIADLCYDPVRDVLWIADSDRHTINLCTLEGQIRRSYPMPFIDNGEGLYVDHEHGCIWIGDDTSSKLYRIPFDNL